MNQRPELTPRTPTPEQSEGPYYLDLDLVRSDIRENRPGVPLRLAVITTTPDSAPVAGAIVDVWHCDALGVYSWQPGRPKPPAGSQTGAGLASGTFLRGRQRSDERGSCHFQTIYPGWYVGRSVHIHVKVRHAAGMLTTQLYFPEALTDVVHEQPPYRARSRRDTVNPEDAVFDAVGDATLLDPAPLADGYAGAITLVLADPAGC